jgi:diadenosine tetraphosphatase ApaH/serine/threonine PP2A family protein phosphatase
MIWAILSDVHGNLEALQAVLEDCRSEETRELVFLGDAVGYGANPNECLSLLENATDLRIAGNHDYGSVGLTDASYFNPAARAAIEWTASVLTEENRASLRRLAPLRQVGEVTLVHASLPRPEEWDYIFTAEDAEESFRRLPGKALWIGHSHRPLIVARDPKGRLRARDADEIVMEEGKQYLINSGSVGQPRDHNPLAAYGLYDDALGKYRLKRVAYDIETAQEKILRAGLPPSLARRLFYGQ